MRSLAVSGVLAGLIVLAAGASSCHTGAPPAAAGESSPPADAAPAPSARVDMNSVTVAGAVEVVADAGDAAAEPAHCVKDPKVLPEILVRLANHSRGPRAGEPRCTIHRLALEIPSLGIDRDLCSSSCGPFVFDSQKREPSRATFACEQGKDLKAGTVWVQDDVVYFEKHDKDASGLASDPPDAARPLPPDAIPLPCGSHTEIRTAGRQQATALGPAVEQSW